MVRGIIMVSQDSHTHGWLAVIVPLAALLGFLKGALVLRKTAARSAARIETMAERTPWWQLFNPATYLLIAGMMGFGVACRWAGAHWHVIGIVGVLYLLIGIALLFGSQAYWRFQVSGFSVQVADSPNPET